MKTLNSIACSSIFYRIPQLQQCFLISFFPLPSCSFSLNRPQKYHLFEVFSDPTKLQVSSSTGHLLLWLQLSFRFFKYLFMCQSLLLDCDLLKGKGTWLINHNSSAWLLVQSIPCWFPYILLPYSIYLPNGATDS